MNQKTRDTTQTIPNMIYVHPEVIISLYLSPNSRTKQMHRTWRDTERQCSVHCVAPSVSVVCYEPNLEVEIVIYTSFNGLQNFIIIICHNGECFIFFNSILNPFLYRWQIRYKRSTKADNPTSSMPCTGFDLFRRLHVLFLPKLFINDVCQEYHLIKSKENYKQLLLIFYAVFELYQEQAKGKKSQFSNCITRISCAEFTHV